MGAWVCIYILIYMLMCVCVCVCTCIYVRQEEAVKRDVLGREVLVYRFPADVAGSASVFVCL